MSPASSGVWPWTICRNCASRNTAPNAPRLNTIATTFATVNPRSRNSRRGSSGAAARRSRRTKRDEREHPDGERAEHLRTAPARVVAAHDAEHQSDDAEGGEHDARDVEPHPHAGDAGQREQRERDRDDGDRHVQPEDRGPVPAVDDRTADDRAECDAEAGDAAPDADRGGPQPVRHRADEQRERQRHGHRGAGALHGTGGDQERLVPGERAGGGGEREDGDAEDEDAAAAEPVAETDREEHQGGERERVRVGDPLQPLDVRTEVGMDGGERGGDDEVVERGHEHGHAGREDGEPERGATHVGPSVVIG